MEVVLQNEVTLFDGTGTQFTLQIEFITAAVGIRILFSSEY